MNYYILKDKLLEFIFRNFLGISKSGSIYIYIFLGFFWDFQIKEYLYLYLFLYLYLHLSFLLYLMPHCTVLGTRQVTNAYKLPS